MKDTDTKNQERELRRLLSHAVMIEHKFTDTWTTLEVRFLNPRDCDRAIPLVESLLAPTDMRFSAIIPEGDMEELSACQLVNALEAGKIAFKMNNPEDIRKFKERFGHVVHRDFTLNWQAAEQDPEPTHLMDNEGMADMNEYAAWIKLPETKKIAPNRVALMDTRYEIEACLQQLQDDLSKRADRR